jgi:hypothetical protein
MTNAVQIGVRIPQATADRLDRLRGRQSRAEFVRRILLAAVKEHDAAPADPASGPPRMVVEELKQELAAIHEVLAEDDRATRGLTREIDRLRDDLATLAVAMLVKLRDRKRVTAQEARTQAEEFVARTMRRHTGDANPR